MKDTSYDILKDLSLRYPALKESEKDIITAAEIIAETYKIQEYHLPVYHTLCLALENEFFGE